MDGKHVMLQAPIHTGSDYFNYKGFFSIVLLAMVDANYCFTYVSVGCQGRLSYGGVFANSTLKQYLLENKLELSDPTPLTGRTFPVPYFIVADAAFPLQLNVRCIPSTEKTTVTCTKWTMSLRHLVSI